MASCTCALFTYLLTFLASVYMWTMCSVGRSVVMTD